MKVKATEIQIALSYQEAYYLAEAVFSYEKRHIESGKDPYLPELFLSLQKVGDFSFDIAVTDMCRRSLNRKGK